MCLLEYLVKNVLQKKADMELMNNVKIKVEDSVQQ
jgi:hypothetical protein